MLASWMWTEGTEDEGKRGAKRKPSGLMVVNSLKPSSELTILSWSQREKRNYLKKVQELEK